MFRLIEKNNLKYYTIDSFDKYTKNCFTTRLGGVSENEYSSMNLRFHCNDKKENVIKNFEIISDAIGVNYKNLVLSNQIHETNVVNVTHSDMGNGITKENKFQSADALICAERGVPIVTFFADCVPVFFLDPKNGVIALAHSGWKGTVNNIVKSTVSAFVTHFGSNPKDIIAAIGPSIGVCCFEVGDEVSDAFYDKFGKDVLEKHGKKWHVNLQKTVYNELIDEGIEDITLAGICTACNSDLLFSHRKTAGKRGNMAAILELK